MGALPPGFWLARGSHVLHRMGLSMVFGRSSLPRAGFWGQLWLRLAIQGALLVGGVFAGYEIIERTLLEGASAGSLHRLHILRGMGTAFLLGSWSFLQIRRARRDSDARLEENLLALEERVRERTRALGEAQAFTELLFNSLRERIIVVDGEGRVVKANRVAEEAAGRALLGVRCSEAFASCTRPGCCALEALGPGEVRVEVRADERGRLWELETIVVPRCEGRPGVVIEVGRDVTERSSLEAQVRHQEKMAGLGLLTAGFAHDLGNPLASLSTELELLDGENDVERFRESLTVLRRHVSRMSRTLREMVDFARRRRDEVADVSLACAVSDAARLVSHDPRLRRIALRVDVPADLPPVHMVEDHLVLVLINLMLNAADAMPQGGPLVISARHDRGHVVLRVKDAGTGMTPEVKARALLPLYTTKTGGTGLGLSVCSGIARSVGGSFELESAPGAGTCVVVSLPAAAPARA
jgi:signal transduction histidine kinase